MPTGAPNPVTYPAAPPPKGVATPNFHIGQISIVSDNGGTLCLAVPVTASNSGTGAVYAVTVKVQISGWSSTIDRAGFPVAPHHSGSATWTMCAPGFSTPPGVCDAVSAGVLHFWGDPTPNLATLYSIPSAAGSICVPR